MRPHANPNMWLSENVFAWEAANFSVSSTDPQNFFRAYELLHHAESLIANSTTDLHVADCISNLKRALNQRLKYIDELYCVRSAFPKNFGFLECLNELGLARPFVIKQLFEIRNDIEHNDATPPTHARCLELLDMTWYFLKSTDSICASRRESLDLQIGEGLFWEPEYSFSAYPQQSNDCKIKFHGRFPAAALSKAERSGFFRFHCEEIRTKNEMLSRVNEIHDDFRKIEEIRLQARRDDDLFVTGNATLQPHLYQAVLKKLLITTPGFS